MPFGRKLFMIESTQLLYPPWNAILIYHLFNPEIYGFLHLIFNIVIVAPQLTSHKHRRNPIDKQLLRIDILSRLRLCQTRTTFTFKNIRY